MGTIVLSPQDCLSSPHNRQNYHFSSARRPKPDKGVSQVVMVPLSTVQNSSRQDNSAGSPPQDGILPIPHLQGQARAPSRRPPFFSKKSSTCSTPPTRKTTAGSAPLMVKSKLSRSASAILPTPLTGSPCNVEGDGTPLLKGRLPFKVVQGYCSASPKVDAAHRSSLKRHLDTRHHTHKKTTTSSMRIINVQVVEDGPHDGKPSNPVHDGADLEKPKKVAARNQKILERSQSGKGPHERHDKHIHTPSVTILRRPKSKEAAAELFAKFFLSNDGQDVVPANDQVDFTPNKTEDMRETKLESEISQLNSMEGLSDSDGLDHGACQTSLSCSTDDELTLAANKFVRESSMAGFLKHAVSRTLACPIVETYIASRETSKDFMPESDTEKLSPWERWAGPSYFNSPHPSSLPLPRFSGVHMKNVSMATIDMVDDAVFDQALMPTSAFPALCANLSGKRRLFANSDAIASATKDLRRILNLDFYRV